MLQQNTGKGEVDGNGLAMVLEAMWCIWGLIILLFNMFEILYNSQINIEKTKIIWSYEAVLIKDAQDFFVEDYKTLLRQIKENLSKYWRFGL